MQIDNSIAANIYLKKKFLHVGCGPKRKAQTTVGFNTSEWDEVRLDIDASVAPDVIGTMTAMDRVESGSMDAIFSSHNIEHLYPHEVPVALAEFVRVLNPTGVAVITCPDLQSVCALVANNQLTQPAYQSKAGPIAPLDILYGHRSAMAKGNLYMAHRSGFTRDVLQATLQSAGFQSVVAFARPSVFDLWAFASKATLTKESLMDLVKLHGLAK
jgi:predicted SAM-dependent methyltransferase